MPVVLTAAAEHAESEINLAHGLFQRSVRCLETDRGGRQAYGGRLGYGLQDLRVAELAAGATFRIMGVGEEFGRTVLNMLIERVESGGSPLEQVLMGRSRPKDDLGWRGLLEFTSEVFGISIGDFQSHGPLNGFVEARNSIAHGGRRLTRLQERKRSQAEARLRAAGIELDGSHLKLGPRHVRDCRDVVLGYVGWLDGKW